MTTTWRGVTLDDRSAAMMDEVEALTGYTLDPLQGSYSTSVGASAGTHDGGGAIDISIAGIDADVLVYSMRMVGWAAYERTTAEGFTPHVHGIAVGCPDLSTAAADQVTDYLEGRNGLASNAPDNGPREFVGQTWEGYLAGSPPGGPTRAFRGAQLGIDDVVVTAGALDPYFGPTGVFNNVETRNDSQAVTLVAGDEFYVYLTGADFEATDIIATIFWRLNASGHGTVVLAESFDPSYSYTPPFTWTTLGSVVVDRDTLALTATEGLPHAPEDMNGDDGAILLRVTCTTGTVDLDWLVLQVDPPSGLQVIDVDAGHWSTWRTPDEIDETPSYAATCTLANGALDNWTDGTIGIPDGPPPVSGPTPTVDEAVETQVTAATTGTHTETWTGPPVGAPPVLSSSGGQSRLRSDTQWSTPLFATYNHQISTNHANVITTAEWETWPDLREMPSFMTGLTYGVDYAIKPGASGSTSDPEVVGEFAAGDTITERWEDLDFDASIVNFWPDLLNPTADVTLTSTASTPGSIATGGGSVYDFSDLSSYVAGGGSGIETATGGPFTVELPHSGWTLGVVSSLDIATTLPAPTTTGGWNPPEAGSSGGGSAGHGATVEVFSPDIIKLWLQMPDYRYWIPAWIRSPDAIDDTPAEPAAFTYLRNKQRNDGLGNWSAGRGRSRSSQQRSIRGRGYR